MLSGQMTDGAHVFVDQQLIAVTIDDGLLHGCNESVPSSHCEVYAPAGIMSWVLRVPSCAGVEQRRCRRTWCLAVW